MENKTVQNQNVESTPYIAEVKPINIANLGQKLIVCDMCGHANPEFTALCQMCSNYLITKG